MNNSLILKKKKIGIYTVNYKYLKKKNNNKTLILNTKRTKKVN